MDICALCRSSKIDTARYGEMLRNKSMAVHTFCLYLTSNLCQSGDDDDPNGLLGFLPGDIKPEIKRISRLNCCFCSKSHANIGCCEKKCRRTFHLICGIEHGAENQFVGTFKSFCNKHVRKSNCSQPSAAEQCCICYDKLRAPGQRFSSVNMLRAPCCQNGWFHKVCLQTFANTAGYFFKCPLCNDTEIFCGKLPYKGIFIPNRDAAWELEPNAFAELLERPNMCAAAECQCTGGREENGYRNPLLTCTTCGSIAMHKHCLEDKIKGNNFYCNDCNIGDDSGHESLQSMQPIDVDSEIDELEVEVDCDNSYHTEVGNTLAVESNNIADNEEDDEELIHTCRLKQNLLRIIDDIEVDSLTSEDEHMFSHSRKLKRTRVIVDDSEDEKEEKRIRKTQVDKDNKCLSATKENLLDCTAGCSKSSFYETDNCDTDNLDNSKCSDGRQNQSSPILIQDSFIADDIADDSVDELEAFIISCMQKTDGDIAVQKVTEVSKGEEKDYNSIVHKTTDVGINNSTTSDISSLAKRTRRKSLFISPENLREAVTAGSSVFEYETDNQHVGKKSSSSARNEDNNSIDNNCEEIGTKNPTTMDTSCIAKRTRRKSIFVDSEIVCKANEHINAAALDISCVAHRTRRKSICISSENEYEAATSRSITDGTYHTVQRTSNQKHLNAEQSTGSYEATTFNSSTLNYNVSEHVEVAKSIILDMSCIAKRTRRKSLYISSQSSSDSDKSSYTSGNTNQTSQKFSYSDHNDALMMQNIQPYDISCIAVQTRHKFDKMQRQNSSESSESESIQQHPTTVSNVADISTSTFESIESLATTSPYVSYASSASTSTTLYNSFASSSTTTTSAVNTSASTSASNSSFNCRTRVFTKRTRRLASRYSLSTDDENCLQSQDGSLYESRVQRNLRNEIAKSPMHVRRTNIDPYIMPKFKRENGKLRKANYSGRASSNGGRSMHRQRPRNT